MLSPEALSLESLAVSALTLSVCSQFISSAEEPPSPTAGGGRVGLGWEPGTLPGSGPTQEPVLPLSGSESPTSLRAARISEELRAWRWLGVAG